MQAQQVPKFELPTSTVELSVRCENLADRDLLSKSDPMCVMFVKPAPAGDWIEFGRTEVAKDNLSPAWEKRFVIAYSFEQRQMVKFEIYDHDGSSSQSLKKHDFLGRCETSLGAIVSSNSSRFVSALRDAGTKFLGKQRPQSKITVVAEELQSSKESFHICLAAANLDKKDFLGKSDPFFVVRKSIPNGWAAVKSSEVVMKNLSPAWKPFEISARDLCNCDKKRPLKIDIYDWDRDGSHDFIGAVVTTAEKLELAAKGSIGLEVVNEEKQRRKKSYKNSGTLSVKAFVTKVEVSFIDYLQGGVSMNFSVAIDFTASNGDPRQPGTLHHVQPGQDNQYTTALKSVGEIIQDYDSDRQFPALGFGARIPATGQVSHEFFLNLRQDTPFCSGVDGLLAAYFNAIDKVQLYGPTNFAPVINHVAQFARAYEKSGDQYFVLLIITDGIITDMAETKSAIVNASNLPMSIIIVGVGSEQFDSMEELDGDKSLLVSGGRRATRDIVQFVELRKFVRGSSWSKDMLAKEVLAEIPRQFLGWMKSRNILPAANTKANL